MLYVELDGCFNMPTSLVEKDISTSHKSREIATDCHEDSTKTKPTNETNKKSPTSQPHSFLVYISF